MDCSSASATLEKGARLTRVPVSSAAAAGGDDPQTASASTSRTPGNMGSSSGPSAQRDLPLVQGELRAARRLERLPDLPLAGAGASGEERLEEARVEVIRSE